MQEDDLLNDSLLHVHYHSFADNNDDWLRTFEEALGCVEKWKEKGCTNLRIYEVGVYANKIGETFEDEGTYVYGEGQFPL